MIYYIITIITILGLKCKLKAAFSQHVVCGCGMQCAEGSFHLLNLCSDVMWKQNLFHVCIHCILSDPKLGNAKTHLLTCNANREQALLLCLRLNMAGENTANCITAYTGPGTTERSLNCLLAVCGLHSKKDIGYGHLRLVQRKRIKSLLSRHATSPV